MILSNFLYNILSYYQILEYVLNVSNLIQGLESATVNLVNTNIVNMDFRIIQTNFHRI